MKKRLLNWLRCPACQKGDFALKGAPNACHDVETGTLVCNFCDRRYPVRDGIPRFISDHDPSRTKMTFGKEWELFAEETYQDMAHIRRFVETAWGDVSSFDGKRVIDAGCGPGYFSAVFAEKAYDVVAMDITNEGVAFARRKIGHLPNVHIIQGDLMRLPLKEAFADRVSSTGVLHHTPDPFHGFRSLVSTIRPGGEIAISVYSKYPWPARLCYKAIRNMTTRLTPHAVMNVSRVLVLFSYMPFSLLKWIPYPWAARWPEAAYKRRLWWTYDWYSPRYVNFYSTDQIKKWFERESLEGFTVFPEIGGYYKGKRRRGH